MKNKLTIVKVVGSAFNHPTVEDLTKWRELFDKNEKDQAIQDAIANGSLSVEQIDTHDAESDDHTITFVKIGDENYKPSLEDLERWKEVFEEAKTDPDFTIFTHPSINVEVVKINKIIAIE